MSQLRQRLTYANVMSTIAVFGVIAGGTALALPGRNSVQRNDIKRNAVGSKHLKDAAVKAPEIAAGAVGTDEVGDGAIGAADIGPGEVGSAALATGAVGSAQIADATVTPADLAPTTFTDVQLVNGWSTYSATNGPLQIAVDPAGFAHLRGAIRQGNNALPNRAFTLPPALRPANYEVFSAVATGGFAVLTIERDGDGTLASFFGGDFEDASFLSGITYRVGT